MNNIKKNIEIINNKIGTDTTLVAVSKTYPVTVIRQAYDGGQRIFGESKIQELVAKYEQLPKNIQWHMIGHLQRNKIKYIAPFIHLIHGVDDFKKLVEINKQAQKYDRTIHCLLQIKIAQESTKFGLSIQDATKIITLNELTNLPNVFIDGFMGMASFTADKKQVKDEFKTLYQFFTKSKEWKNACFNPTILSMGMSGDYQTAVECGSTMVRIGSAIFGDRNYNH